MRAKTRPVLLGLVASGLVFGGTYLVGDARPLLQTSPTNLGTAKSFGVLGSSTVTNTGPSVVHADLGVYAGSAVTGFPPGLVVGGTIHAADAVALQAQNDATAAYGVLAGQTCPAGSLNHLAKQRGGVTLNPGVYCMAAAQITGTLTLDFLGDPASVFVFQSADTLITAPAARVVLTNTGGGTGCNVFWQVASSATLDTTTQFVGTIIALASIHLKTGANLNGRALARTAEVTMDTNVVSLAGCAAGLPTAVPTVAPAAPVAPVAAVPTITPGAQTRPPNTPTRTAIPVTETAVPTVTRTAVPTQLPATATVAPAAAPSETPIPPVALPVSTPAAAAANASQGAPAANSNVAAPAANSSVSAQAGQTPAPINTATPIPVALVAPPAQIPASLPRTGGGLPPLGVLSVLLGGAVAVIGLKVRRTRR